MTQAFLNLSLEELAIYLGVSLPLSNENIPLVALPNDDTKVESWYPVITADRPKELQFFQWGFVLFWMPGSSIANRAINAAVETIFTKPAFKEAANKCRCLIPISGFWEFGVENGIRVRYRIEPKDSQILFVAGIWEQFPTPDGNWNSINAFLSLTHESNNFMKRFNKRMPFILSSSYERLWLNLEYETGDLLEIMEPVDNEILTSNDTQM